MKVFNVTRIYADENGDTHFEALSMPLTASGPIGYLSESMPVKNIIFRKVEPDYDYTFHTAPHRQFIVLLDVGIEVETSLGDKRQFQAGEVLQVEDVTGKGHRSRNLEAKERSSIFITY
ncbi:hypothetical protein GZH53_17560 [Flavihumibacter sp. R14]|nr:hypothetical protein [Flavihumibacter soli]